jgi:hypothetical protein
VFIALKRVCPKLISREIQFPSLSIFKKGIYMQKPQIKHKCAASLQAISLERDRIQWETNWVLGAWKMNPITPFWVRLSTRTSL